MRLRLLAGVIAGILALPTVQASGATSPLTLTPSNGWTKPLTWEGTAVLAPAGQQQDQARDLSFTVGAQHQRVRAMVSPWRQGRASLWIHWETPEDLMVRVTNGNGLLFAASDNAAGVDEVVSFDVYHGVTYVIEVYAKAGAPTGLRPQYEAAFWMRTVDGINTTKRPNATLKYVKPNVCNDVNYKTNAQGAREAIGPDPCYVALKVPVNIVFVGFDRDEVLTHTPEIAGLFPDSDVRAPRIKPVVENESSVGGGTPLAREGGAQVRQAFMLQGSGISHLPYGFDFGDPNIVVADEAYSRALFAAAKSYTTPGEYLHAWDRAYLESYNAHAAGMRRDHPAVPGAQVDFIDAMKLEDWVAKHPPKGLAFDLNASPLQFTYFVLDTYRPAYAGEYFNLDRYHHFRVMNALTVDPDTGEQRGFDWGRVWGGRYRFLMLDTGAAPNSFEGSTPANGGAYRTAGGGDSALLDPPVWEYAGCAAVDCRDLLPIFYQRIGENAVNALFMRFARGFESRPRATDRFVIGSNTWIDADATLPEGAGGIDGLYKAGVVAQRLRELMPYTRVDLHNRTKTLGAGDREQQALEAARAQSLARLPSGIGADPHPVMRLIEPNRNAYAPKGTNNVSIPIVNVVHPGAAGWNGAGEDGTVVADLGPDPWGLLQGLSDVDLAVRAGEDAAETTLPGRRGFTASALRNAGRVLGLHPATEGIVYNRELPPDVSQPRPHAPKPDEQHRAYYKTFDWTHATTATPMSNGWFYGRFEVLDRDAIGLAHAFDWLDRALSDIEDAFAILDVRGYTAPPQNVTDQILRAGRFMGEMVGWAQAGRMTKAVAAARTAKRETAKVVWLAARAPVRR